MRKKRGSCETVTTERPADGAEEAEWRSSRGKADISPAMVRRSPAVKVAGPRPVPGFAVWNEGAGPTL